MTSITLGILLALNEHGRIEGTDTLAEILRSDPKYVVVNARNLDRLGLITIHPGSQGRGNKTIYEKKLASITVANKDRKK